MPQKIKVNDIMMNYEIVGEGGSTVMLLNGLGGNLENFKLDPALLNALAEKHRVVLLDNRGSGETDRGVKNNSARLMADDLAELMNALEIEKAHVFGGSMGGMIAQEFAINYPEKLLKLGLAATWCGGERTVRPEGELWEYVCVPGHGDPMQMKDTNPLLLVFSPNSVEEMGEAAEELSTSIFSVRDIDDEGFAGQQIACRVIDTYDRLKNIKAPTIVFAPKYDILVPVENNLIIAKQIPDCKFVFLENSAHAMMEDQDVFINAFLDFIDS